MSKESSSSSTAMMRPCPWAWPSAPLACPLAPGAWPLDDGCAPAAAAALRARRLPPPPGTAQRAAWEAGVGAAPQGGRCRHPANGDCPQASQAGGSKSAQQEPGGLTWCGRPARLPPPWRCGALGGRRRRRCCGCYRGQRQVTQRAQRTVSWHSTPSGDVCFGEHPPCTCRGEAGRGSHESMHLLVLCRAAAACRRQQRPPGGPRCPSPPPGAAASGGVVRAHPAGRCAAPLLLRCALRRALRPPRGGRTAPCS